MKSHDDMILFFKLDETRDPQAIIEESESSSPVIIRTPQENHPSSRAMSVMSDASDVSWFSISSIFLSVCITIAR